MTSEERNQALPRRHGIKVIGAGLGRTGTKSLAGGRAAGYYSYKWAEVYVNINACYQLPPVWSCNHVTTFAHEMMTAITNSGESQLLLDVVPVL